MSVARLVIAWLQQEQPRLDSLTVAACQSLYDDLRARYREWTVRQRMNKLRTILDRAVAFGMIASNPARAVKLRQPRTARARHYLSIEEAQQLLERSLEYRHAFYGGLPTIVRLHTMRPGDSPSTALPY